MKQSPIDYEQTSCLLIIDWRSFLTRNHQYYSEIRKKLTSWKLWTMLSGVWCPGSVPYNWRVPGSNPTI